MSKLLLPLQNYDEAGRIKPPRFFWLCALLLAKSYFIFVLSLSNFRDADALLTVFYPRPSELYIGLGIGFSAVLAIGIVAYREKWWGSKWLFLGRCIKPLLLIAVSVDIAHQMQLLFEQHWLFSWAIAFSILTDMILLYWTLKSRHLRYMIQDWQVST